MIYPDGTERITPDLSYRPMTAHAAYVNSCTGLALSAPELAALLERMTHLASAVPGSGSGDDVAVQVPPTRPDILHECDLMEDAAIAYGFNNLPDTFPQTSTVAQPLELSKLSDIIRREWALAGFVEVLPLILVSRLRPAPPTLLCSALPSAPHASADPPAPASARTKKTSPG